MGTLGWGPKGCPRGLWVRLGSHQAPLRDLGRPWGLWAAFPMGRLRGFLAALGSPGASREALGEACPGPQEGPRLCSPAWVAGGGGAPLPHIKARGAAGAHKAGRAGAGRGRGGRDPGGPGGRPEGGRKGAGRTARAALGRRGRSSPDCPWLPPSPAPGPRVARRRRCCCRRSAPPRRPHCLSGAAAAAPGRPPARQPRGTGNHRQYGSHTDPGPPPPTRARRPD